MRPRPPGGDRLSGRRVTFLPMAADPSSSSLRGGVTGALALLAVSNLATNRWLPRSAYVPWNLGMAAGLVVMARSAGLGIEDLGLDPRRLRKGARTGAVGVGMVGLGYATLLTSGWAEALLHDERLTSLSPRDALWHLLVRIPLGTVLAEEIAFRSVLPALLRSSPLSPAATPFVTSLLFGLWHVLPSRDQSRANGNEGSRSAQAWVAVAATALGGGLLHRVRVRTGHVAAPIALHLASNAFGLLAVRITGSRR